jgi:hypothetical protein
MGEKPQKELQKVWMKSGVVQEKNISEHHLKSHGFWLNIGYTVYLKIS